VDVAETEFIENRFEANQRQTQFHKTAINTITSQVNANAATISKQ